MARSGSNQKGANSLLALSSAAVLAVYSAGYFRTRSAADRLANQSLERRAVRQPPPPEAATVSAPLPVETLNPSKKAKLRPSSPRVDATPTETPAVAPVVEQPAPTAPAPAAIVWKDGKYTGWGGSRHGDIQATVIIEGGHIVSAEISDCQTRYPCDVIEKLPPQVVQRQSPNVDRVGGATESADAFYSAVYFALKQAQ